MGAFAGNMPVGTLNVALSNFAKEFRNNALVGELIAPRVPVDRQSFQYVVFDRSDMRLDRQTLRAPGDRPQTDRMSYSVAPYMAQSHALSARVPREQEAYALGLGFSEKQKATQRLINKINLDRENSLATLITNPGNVPNNLGLSGGTMFDCWQTAPATYYANGVYTGGDPILLIDQYKALLRQAGIQDADMMLIVSDPVGVALRSHPKIIDRFKYTNVGGLISYENLSSVFGVPTKPASAIMLDKSNVASWVWGVNAILLHSEAATSMQDISACKTFTWMGAPDSVDGYGVLEFPDPYLDAKTDWISVDWYWDIRITATEAMVLFTNCVAAPVMGAIAAPAEG